MQNNCKKIISGFFLLLWFTPLLFLLLTTLEKIEIREKMEEKLDTEKLQTIVLAQEKVIWMDKHEIWVNEHMFDIHSKKLENGIYTFTGLYDEDETDLVKKERKATGDNNGQNKLLAQLFKNLPSFYNTVSEDVNIPPSLHSFYFFDAQHSISQFKEIVTPPPQV